MKDFIEYSFFKFKLLPGDKLRLTSYRGNEREVTVPGRVMHYTVTELGEGETVTGIEAWCFSECTGLTRINIPAGVTELPYRAFDDCSNLETVILENKSCVIHPKAFDDMPPEII